MKRTILVIIGFALLLGLCACATMKDSPTWQEQYDLGVRYLSEGNYEEAIIAFTAAIEIDPKQAPAFMGRGDTYMLSGETEENLAAAQADYEQALKLEKTSEQIYLSLANVYILQGKYEQASNLLREGYDAIGAQELLDMINNLSAQIMAKEDEWIFTHDMVKPEELTVGGLPFWEVDINKVAMLYPTEDERGSWFEFDGETQYTAMRNHHSVVNSKQNDSETGLNEFDINVTDYTELRSIMIGMHRQDALKSLGISDAGIEYCMKFDFGKVLRFVCKDNIWREDIGVAGTVNPGTAVEFIWINHKSGQELILGLYFDEFDTLNRILYNFMELGYDNE